MSLTLENIRTRLYLIIEDEGDDAGRLRRRQGVNEGAQQENTGQQRAMAVANVNIVAKCRLVGIARVKAAIVNPHKRPSGLQQKTSMCR